MATRSPRGRKHQAGDVVAVVKKLREAMASLQSVAFELDASFIDIDPRLDARATVARRAVELAETRVSAFLQQVEGSEAYALFKRIDEDKR